MFTNLYQQEPSVSIKNYSIDANLHFFICNLFTDQAKKVWSFDLSAYQEVQDKVAALKPDVVIGTLPKYVLKLLKQGK